MLLYILYCIADLLFNIIAYITNPIIVLFANEVGELPEIFKWWANWDDGLDVDWMVYEHHVPWFAEYDFNRHYKYHSEWEAETITGQHKGFVELLDPNFTFKERLQRYFCRLAWLYRNCAYGFSYYITGRDIDGDKVITEYGERGQQGDNELVRYFGHYKWWWIHEPFCYFLETIWNPKDVSWLKWTKIDHDFYMKIFVGWKHQFIEPGKTERCMLAMFAWPFDKVE